MTDQAPLNFTPCGAKTRSGAPCAKAPVSGSKRCRMHGGKSPRGGPGHHLFKHGRSSKIFPARIQERFNNAYEDPDLLSARSDAAILEVRLLELIDRLHTGESGHLWTTLSKAWGEFQAASRMLRKNTGDDSASESAREKAKAISAEALNKIGQTIQHGVQDEAVWQEIDAAIKSKVSVAAIEHRRLIDMNQMLSTEQVMVLCHAMVHVNRQIVDKWAAEAKFDGKAMMQEISFGLAKFFNRAPIKGGDGTSIVEPGSSGGLVLESKGRA